MAAPLPAAASYTTNRDTTERCVEVFDRAARRRAVYRLRGDRMVGLADPP